MLEATPQLRRSGPELVGRREELRALEDELGRMLGGEFRLVLLLGEAGVGKSRLGRELLARHREVTGLVAQAYPLASSAAFGLWIEAIDQYLRTLSDDEVVEMCGGLLDDLASLFHRVALVRGSVPQRDPPLPRLLQGLAGLIGNVSRRRPLVVLLDDVHFADASSWQALRYFARHLDDARLLVLATSRPADLAAHDVAAQVLFELGQDSLLSRLEVEALPRSGLTELVEATIERPAPRALVDWLAERSQGNPLFAIGLLRALLEERGALDAPHLQRLPEGLTERVTSELRRFEAAPRGVLERLAVVGRPVSLGDLTTLTSSSLEEIGPVLSRLVEAGIVVEEERGSELSYGVYHPLVRDVIYQETSGAQRRVLHRQAGRSLLRAGHLAEAALHFARSAGRGDSEAVEVLLDAMRQAERREAFREALDLQAEIVELLPPGDERWLEVLEAMYARAEWLIDHRAETHAPVAIRALRAIDGLLAASTDHAQRAVVKFRLANFLAWGTGDLDAAYEACRQAHELFERAGDRRQTLLAARELAWIRGLQGDLDAMGTGAQAVVEQADAVDDRFVTMQGLAAVGYSANFRGAFAEAEAAQQRAATIARQDEKAYRLTLVLAGIALGLALQGRATETAPLFEEAKAANPAYRESILVELEATVSWLAGDFPAAVALAHEALAWEPTATARRRAIGMAVGALAAIERDDAVEAERLSARALAAYGGRDWSFFLQVTYSAQALVAWQAGRAADAVGILRAAVARLLEMHSRPWAALLLVELAEAAADAGDDAAAANAAGDLHDVAEFIGLPLYHGLAETASAWAKLAAGDDAQGVASARRAIQLLSGTDWAAHLARAHLVLGRALSAGERAEAVAALERAAAMLEQCGGTWRRQRVLDALRRLGSAGRRAAAAALGPDSLTRREREVARLAATGMTAKEIAGALFVGERTVESHLASIYAKLGVESKLQLVRRAAELGLA
jgi:DNA-binding NarL/FixJ family response regulator/tetratricopeptide (TPR) repeat protein